MFGKLEISGCIESLTGLHIGGGSQFAAIGAVDSVVVKDIDDDLPMIPGSSLKGKLRSLLSKQFSDGELPKEHNSDADVVKRLFGHTDKSGPKTGRVYFSDIFMSKESRDRLENEDIDATEVKFENTIDRITAEANPRQIERAIRDSIFGFELIYEVTDKSQAQVEEDFKVILDGLKLLELDYLGGSGSRGYGKVVFENLKANTVFGNYDASTLNELLTTEV